MRVSDIFPTAVKLMYRTLVFCIVFYAVLNIVVWHFNNAKLLGISKMIQRNVRINGFISNRDLEAMENYIKMQYPYHDDADYDPLNDTYVVGLTGVIRNVKIVEGVPTTSGTNTTYTWEEIKKNSSTVNKRVNRGTLKVVGVQYEYHWLNPLEVLKMIEPKVEGNAGEDVLNNAGIVKANNTVGEDFWFRDTEEYREELKENYNLFGFTMEMVNPVMTEKFYADLPRVTS